jgi:hypothetical protein
MRGPDSEFKNRGRRDRALIVSLQILIGGATLFVAVLTVENWRLWQVLIAWINSGP